MALEVTPGDRVMESCVQTTLAFMRSRVRPLLKPAAAGRAHRAFLLSTWPHSGQVTCTQAIKTGCEHGSQCKAVLSKEELGLDIN